MTSGDETCRGRRSRCRAWGFSSWSAACCSSGPLTRPAALVLGLDMIGALATAGRVEGGSFRLDYAPLLLGLMLFLAWAGPGRLSLDECLRGRPPPPKRLTV